ncbi:hypothetical protein VNO77_06073 [Canavalia gladiata]|uniref:Uncharacterized protein n=1 Tax=Canavalia gladiata TaxID=3824 RepID=A0AAN9N071_CANGL
MPPFIDNLLVFIFVCCLRLWPNICPFLTGKTSIYSLKLTIWCSGSGIEELATVTMKTVVTLVAVVLIACIRQAFLFAEAIP